MRVCGHCKEKKEYKEFYKNKNYADGYYSICKICTKKKQSKYYNTEKYREKERARHLKRTRIKRGLPLDHPRMQAPNGSGCLNSYGYRLICKKGHPNSRGKQGAIFEHTFVMSEYLGRPLNKSESVHHKNGIRDDNRIENLELWKKGQPAGSRLEDKLKWAKELLEEYGYKVIKE